MASVRNCVKDPGLSFAKWQKKEPWQLMARADAVRRKVVMARRQATNREKYMFLVLRSDRTEIVE